MGRKALVAGIVASITAGQRHAGALPLDLVEASFTARMAGRFNSSIAASGARCQRNVLQRATFAGPRRGNRAGGVNDWVSYWAARGAHGSG